MKRELGDGASELKTAGYSVRSKGQVTGAVADERFPRDSYERHRMGENTRTSIAAEQRLWFGHFVGGGRGTTIEVSRGALAHGR